MRQTWYTRYGKGAFDRLCAAAGLLVLGPLLAILAIMVKLDSRGPVFFCHQRMGQGMRPFGLLKFRSMVQDAARLGPAVTQGGDPRVTRVGRFLRKYKLDELPQLINVVRGDISLVGPRPEVEKYVRLFAKEYAKILQVKPGITDYATLEYRDEEAVLARYDDLEQGYVQEVLPAKIELYNKYLDNIGFLEDIRIILLTLARIVW